MRSGALLLEREPLVAAAVIAAQASVRDESFRQRDVRFFIELFSNWLEATTGASSLGVHNAQIKRALEHYVKVGWARRVGRSPPGYRLAPEGVVELLRRLVERRNLTRLDEFFLVFHVVDAYGARLRGIVAEKGATIRGRTLALDVTALLDTRQLIARERATVAREVERLTVRAEEAHQSSRLAHRLLASGTPLPDVIASVQREYPYDLNGQRTLTEALGGLPPAWQRAEVEEVAERRALGLWAPTRDLLVAYDRVLAQLQASSGSKTKASL